MYEIKHAKRLSQDFVHFLTARASLFTDHKKIKSPNASQIQTFENILWTNCGHFSYWLIFLFFKLMVIHAWRCDFVKLVGRFIRKFATSFHTFLCMTFHVVGPRRYDFCNSLMLLINSFSLARAPQFHHWFDTLFECNPNIHGQEMMLVLPCQHLSWEFSKSVLCFLFFVSVWYRPHTQMKKVLFCSVDK